MKNHYFLWHSPANSSGQEEFHTANYSMINQELDDDSKFVQSENMTKTLQQEESSHIADFQTLVKNYKDLKDEHELLKTQVSIFAQFIYN